MPTNLSLDGSEEQVTVWGHRRKFSIALVPNSRIVEPGDETRFGPGTSLGIATIEGGPVSNGVSVGLAIPVAGLKGLDFTASLAATRDSLSPAGTTGAASAVAGFRLKF